MRIHVELDTDLAPDRVREASLDFTDRRPRLWPNLDPAYYKVLEVGDTWADVVEGNVGRPKIWAREVAERAWYSPDSTDEEWVTELYRLEDAEASALDALLIWWQSRKV